MLTKISRMKKIWLGAVIFGGCTALVLFQKYFQLPFPGYRRIALMGLAFAVASAGAYLAHVRLLQPRLYRMTRREKATSLGLALAIPSLFLLMQGFRAENFCFYILAPQHSLTITLPQQPATDQTVELIWFKTSFQEVNLRTLTANGEWSFPGSSQAIGKPGKAVSLSWKGRVGAEAQLVFKPTSNSLIVQIDWDGHVDQIDLQRPALDAEVRHSASFDGGVLLSQIILLAAVWLFGFFLIFALAIILVTQSYQLPAKAPKRAEWLLYTLPMILVWCFFLLTYWPGMMSPDSINQWRQVQSGSFNDWHPAIHTMLIWLLTRIWNHPAIEGFFQILATSLTVAWGLKSLGEFGVRRAFLWLGAALFALFPVNGFMVITYWKDILYSTALLAFFIVYLKLLLTQGSWLNQRGNLAGMTAIILAASLFRHNGFLTVLLALLPLFFLFRNQWKPLLIALVLLIGLRSLIRGPIYDALKVTRYPGQSNLVLVHHVAAHISAGTPLNAEERAYLNAIHPLPGWPYDCTYAGETTNSPGFSRSIFEQSPWTLRKLSLNLFLRNPRVDIEHMICNGQIIWKLSGYTSIAPLSNKTDIISWVLDNSYGITESSFLPQWLPLLGKFYDLVSIKTCLSKPAFYLLTVLYCLALIILRRRPVFPLIILPLSQTLVVFMFNIVQAFRFMYPVCLMALFSLICLFLPHEKEQSKVQSR